MCEVKWFKIYTDMYENEKLKLIDEMDDRDAIHYIWMRLLNQAGRTNDSGYIYLNKDIPFTEEMLSTIFNRPLNIIKIALTTLQNYKMIEFDDNNYLKIINWETYQNIEGMERVREQTRNRMRKLREKKKNEIKKEIEECEEPVTECDVTVTEQKENKNKNKKENKEIDKENTVVIIDEVRGEKEKADEAEEKALKILSFYEKLTGKTGIFGIQTLMALINSYGEEYVKMAIDKALEMKKVNISYITAILRNWSKDGYPERGIKHGSRKYDSSDNSKFKGFKPKEPRQLTEEERRIAERNLI